MFTKNGEVFLNEKITALEVFLNSLNMLSSNILTFLYEPLEKKLFILESLFFNVVDFLVLYVPKAAFNS